MRKFITVIILMFLLLTIDYGLLTANAAVPHLINYQGRLTDSSGALLNGSYNITFRIYDAETAGNLLWQEQHAGVVIQKGIFSVLLGSVTALDLPFDKPYFLAIQVGSDPEMSPRQRITSAAYAIRAEKAETLNIPLERQGDVLYYNGSSWTRLGAGAQGQYLKTQGTGVNPVWDTPSNNSNVVFSFYGTWHSGQYDYETVMVTKFKKIAGISTVTFHAYIQSNNINCPVSIRVNIGGQTGFVSTKQPHSLQWVNASVDVSSLTNGELYDVSVELDSNSAGADLKSIIGIVS